MWREGAARSLTGHGSWPLCSTQGGVLMNELRPGEARRRLPGTTQSNCPKTQGSLGTLAEGKETLLPPPPPPTHTAEAAWLVRTTSCRGLSK